MPLLKPLVFVSTALLVGLALAQPPEAPKKETGNELIARYDKERTARVMSDFLKELREKGKLSEADVAAVQGFMVRQDEQLKIVRNALYQVTLADDDATLSDDEYAVFWNDFQTLAARYRAQKASETAKLLEQINGAQNVRLKALLSMRGIIGDDFVSITPISENLKDSDLLQYHLKKDLGVEKPKRVAIPDEKAE